MILTVPTDCQEDGVHHPCRDVDELHEGPLGMPYEVDLARTSVKG
jgi:hypothetical protein